MFYWNCQLNTKCSLGQLTDICVSNYSYYPLQYLNRHKYTLLYWGESVFIILIYCVFGFQYIFKGFWGLIMLAKIIYKYLLKLHKNTEDIQGRFQVVEKYNRGINKIK